MLLLLIFLQVDDWPWVKYVGNHSKDMWTLTDQTYTVIKSDVVSKMDTPEVVMRGSRVLYKFTGN